MNSILVLDSFFKWSYAFIIIDKTSVWARELILSDFKEGTDLSVRS